MRAFVLILFSLLLFSLPITNSLPFSSTDDETERCPKGTFPQFRECHSCTVCERIEDDDCRRYCNDGNDADSCRDGYFPRFDECHPCKACMDIEDDCQNYCRVSVSTPPAPQETTLLPEVEKGTTENLTLTTHPGVKPAESNLKVNEKSETEQSWVKMTLIVVGSLIVVAAVATAIIVVVIRRTKRQNQQEDPGGIPAVEAPAGDLKIPNGDGGQPQRNTEVVLGDNGTPQVRLEQISEGNRQIKHDTEPHSETPGKPLLEHPGNDE